jgi:hypothetical protein
MNNNLLSEYERRCPPPHKGDICEHMPTLKLLADQCDHIVEMGTHGIFSSYGFLSGLPKTLICIDYKHPSYYNGDLDLLEKIAEENGVEFEFIEADTRKIEIGKTDLLFIDTEHTYEQLSCELSLHGNKSKKYIVCHDTGSTGVFSAGLNKAIDEFLENNPHWSRYVVYDNCEGLTVMKRSIERSNKNDL